MVTRQTSWSPAWTFTIVMGLLWFVVAAGNAHAGSEATIRRCRREPSSIPFIGGLFAFVAVFYCPWHSPWKWGLLFMALLLDRGSLRLIALGAIALCFPKWLETINKRREESVRRILGG